MMPSQNEQGCLHEYYISWLDSKKETLNEFINSPDSMDMADSFMLNCETKECDSPLYHHMIEKYQDKGNKFKANFQKLIE
jgi:hypothetical protein